jgi:hypothetical protein
VYPDCARFVGAGSEPNPEPVMVILGLATEPEKATNEIEAPVACALVAPTATAIDAPARSATPHTTHRRRVISPRLRLISPSDAAKRRGYQPLSRARDCRLPTIRVEMQSAFCAAFDPEGYRLRS